MKCSISLLMYQGILPFCQDFFLMDHVKGLTAPSSALMLIDKFCCLIFSASLSGFYQFKGNIFYHLARDT